MRKLFYISVGLILSGSLSAQSNMPDSSNVIDDVVIQEEADVLVEEEKVPVNLELDLSNLVKIDDRITWSALDKLKNSDTAEHDHIDVRLATSTLSKIRPAPVKIFQTQFRQVSRWQLDITTAEGSIFRTLTGEGNPPQKIEWDGRSNANEWLSAGSTYSYRLTAFDRAENKRTFPGKPFSVPAFYAREDELLLIGISGSELFSETLGLTAEAHEYAQEAASLIRLFSKADDIAIATDLPDVREFIALLSEQLVIEEKSLQLLTPSNTFQNSILIRVK